VVDTMQMMIRYQQGESGWIVASIDEVPGALSQGRTREEARANVIDAQRLMLKPEPSASTDEESAEPLNLTIAV
jgi:predicted RNase H-like HicB family nuclease